MVSPEALERKKKFLELKKEHQNIEGILAHVTRLEWEVWYDESGTIISASRGENPTREELDKKYNKAEFRPNQVSIIKKVVNGRDYLNWADYRIVVDKFDSSLKSLELKQRNDVRFDDFYLILVEKIKTKDYSIKIKVNKNKVVVSMHKDLLKKYIEAGINNATINGRTQFNLYFTSKNDPSFLFYTLKISLFDLIENGTVEHIAAGVLDNFSVYTPNLFDRYVRI